MKMMVQKLKKTSHHFPKKGVAFLLLFIFILGLLPANALAQNVPPWWAFSFPMGPAIWNAFHPSDLLGGVAMEFFDGMIGGFFMLLQSIGAVFLMVSGALLAWVISPDFISLGFTKNNDFVQEGWGLVRNFANMFFILVMVVIGLATALRIKEYEAKKTLPLLIGIALLINFTPVICGFIIDASNIIMNFFLSNIGMGFTHASGHFIEAWGKYGQMLESDNLGAAGYGFVTALFVFVTAFTYLIFALLFMVRYVALWTLVILSPIAFFCYILPATRKAWSMWWNQFTQWCIVGIIGGFFLYLADRMIILSVKSSISTPAEIEGEGEALNFLSSTFPYLIPVIFLIVGLFVTISSSATGASYITSGAVQGSKWATSKGLAMTKRTKYGQKVEEKKAKIKEKLGLERPGTYRVEKEKERAEIEKTAIDQTKEERAETIGGRTTKHQVKIATQKVALEKGEITGPEAERVVKELKNEGVNLKETLTKQPVLAGVDGIRKRELTRSQGIEEQVEKTSRLKFRQETDVESLKDKDVGMAMSEEQTDEIKTRGTMEQRKALQENFVANENEMEQEILRLGREVVAARNRGQTDAMKKYLRKARQIRNNINTIINDPNFA